MINEVETREDCGTKRLKTTVGNKVVYHMRTNYYKPYTPKKISAASNNNVNANEDTQYIDTLRTFPAKTRT